MLVDPIDPYWYFVFLWSQIAAEYKIAELQIKMTHCHW